MTDFTSLASTKKSMKQTTSVPFATVVDVKEGIGVKLQLYGQKEAYNIYYNSLQPVAPGDKVFVMDVSGTVLIIGKCQY